MPTFEEKLKRLEQLTSDIKRNNISLEDALNDIEVGIKLARGMENEIDKIEGKIQQLMNQPDKLSAEEPQFNLFSGISDTGSAGAPEQGTRQ